METLIRYVFKIGLVLLAVIFLIGCAISLKANSYVTAALMVEGAVASVILAKEV
jgi:hypothetical protein